MFTVQNISYHLTRTAKVKKKKRNNIEKVEPLYIAGENINGVDTLENSLAVPKNVKQTYQMA